MHIIHFRFKKLVISLFFLVFLSDLQAQSQKLIDSLEWLSKAVLSDSSRYVIEEELSWQKRNLSPRESFDHGWKAYRIAEKMEDQEKMATALNRVATYYVSKGYYDSAKTILLGALKLEQETQNHYGMGRAYGQLANSYVAQMSYDSAIIYAKWAINEFGLLEDHRRLSSAYVRLGSIYRQANILDSAIYVLHKALELQSNDSYAIEKAQTLVTLGNLYSDIDILDSALVYQQRAVAIYSTTEDTFELSIALTNMGAIYMKQGEDSLARKQIITSIDLRANHGWSNAENRNNLGIIYQRQHQHKLAEAEFQRALEENQLSNMTKAESLNNLGQLYLSLGQYQDAYEKLKMSLEVLIDDEPNLRKLSIYEGLIKASIQLGLNEEVVRYQLSYTRLRDALESMIKAAFFQRIQIGEQQRRLEILEKDQEVQRAESQKKGAETKALILLIGLILVIGFILFERFRKALRKKSIQLSKQELENEIQEHDINMLSAMIDGRELERKRIAQELHDRLGSILTMAKMHFSNVEKNWEVVKNSFAMEYEKTTQLIDEACHEVRQISYDLSSSVVHKFGLIHALHQLRDTVEASGQLQMEVTHFKVDNQNLTEEMSLNLYRIVQEIVSNTVKHSEAAKLSIQLVRGEDELTLMSEDDGIGFDPKSDRAGKGMGLYNMKSRAERLGGSIHIDSHPGSGTTITVDVPLKKPLQDD